MSFSNWVFETFSSEDVIDLCFILSELSDINLSTTDMYDSAYFDSHANLTAREKINDNNIPLGKQVY